jgi:hypothetical protein
MLTLVCKNLDAPRAATLRRSLEARLKSHRKLLS